MTWKCFNENSVGRLDDASPKRVRASGAKDPARPVPLNRDKKARIADLLHQLEPFVSGAGTGILNRLFNEVER